MPAPHTSPHTTSNSATTIALVRSVSDSIADCELTHLTRQPIDLTRARDQHTQYLRALESVGCELQVLPALPDHPDSVFVEDTALVLDEVAVITRPGANSRQTEVNSTAVALERHRRLVHITAPGTLDGGDILVVGQDIWVGQPDDRAATRSNPAGIEQLKTLLAPFGYRVQPAMTTDCLHLKSAITPIGPNQLLLNPSWVDPETFSLLGGVNFVETHPDESAAGNALLVNNRVIYPDHYLRTRERLEAAGCKLVLIPADELAKAEGGVTCGSIIIN